MRRPVSQRALLEPDHERARILSFGHAVPSRRPRAVEPSLRCAAASARGYGAWPCESSISIAT
jgi:hypothetical protein